MAAWQREMAESFCDLEQLLVFLDLDRRDLATTDAVGQFPFRVTRCFAARMRKRDPHDPLLLQVLPLREELATVGGFIPDPVGDLHSAVVPGVLHKYHGRTLLITTGGCAIACRYCFRRNFPYSEQHLGSRQEAAALAYIAADPSISEVILSGGDPLLLSDRRLLSLAARLSGIPHVTTIRIHTRIPIVLPSRITEALVAALTGTRLQVVVVAHANHPNEIDGSVLRAFRRLCSRDVIVLNQAVLLAGINDDAMVLAELSRSLARASVLPYYLHMLDRAAGTAHFEVDEDRARSIYDELRRLLPGYLTPRLAREESGAPYKHLL